MEGIATQLQPWLASWQETATVEAKPPCDRDGEMLCTVYEELTQLLQQYPGGLTEAVMLTQLQNNITRKSHEKRQETSVMTAAPLASCLGVKCRPAEEILVHGTVCDINSAPGAASIQTLQLVDSSTSSPVGMFVHSHHKPLLEGIKPLLTVGRRVRVVTTLVKQLGLTTLPHLMPTVFCAVCVPAAEWQQCLGSPEQMPGEFSQVYQLRDVLAGGLAALGQQERCTLNGWLTAAVVDVGRAETGFQASNGASSRSWNTGSITLCDTADATDSSSSSGKPSVQWLLLDEAVKYARLLQAGEHILMYCPTVRRHQQHRQQDPDLVLESSSGLWLLVNEDSGSHCSSSSHIDKDACYTTDAQESGQAGIQAEPSSASKVAAFASSPHRVPEASCGQYMVLRGIVSNLLVPKNTSSSSNNLHMRDSSTRMTCCISDTAADMLASRNRLLELQFEPDSRKKQQFLKGLRNGHMLLLTRVIYHQQGVHLHHKQRGNQVRHLVWQESAGGVIRNLSRLPAMLTTPALQHTITLEQLQQGESCLKQPGLLVVSAAIQAADLRSCRLHRVCSGSVLQGSRLQKDCDQNDDGIADDGAAAAITTDANHYLWSCEFCDVECSGRETEPGFTGHVLLTDVSKSGADAVKVEVDSSAWQMLQPAVTPGPAMEAMLSKGTADDSSRLLQLTVTEKLVKAALYARMPFVWGISAWQESDN